MTDAIRLRGVDYRASKEFAIRDLAMTVPKGSVYGFLGPNGSGKTTAIRLMLGMLPAAAGTIDVLGHDVPRQVHRALAKIGYVPERNHLWAYLTVEEVIRCTRRSTARGTPRALKHSAQQFNLRSSQTCLGAVEGRGGQTDDAARALDTTRSADARRAD